MAKKKSRATARPQTSGAGLAPKVEDDLVGKRIQIERATYDAISLMGREQMKDLTEITEEAFRDLLKKYGRTADFREALKMSAKNARKTARKGG